MTPFYSIFTLFTVAALVLKYLLIDPYADTFPTLIVYAVITYFPLLILYFLLLFATTDGMKYFVARKPHIYKFLKNGRNKPN